MYVSANQGVFSLRAALTILVIVLITVAVAVQLFRIGRTIVSGWTLSLRSNTRRQIPCSRKAHRPSRRLLRLP